HVILKIYKYINFHIIDVTNSISCQTLPFIEENSIKIENLIIGFINKFDFKVPISNMIKIDYKYKCKNELETVKIKFIELPYLFLLSKKLLIVNGELIIWKTNDKNNKFQKIPFDKKIVQTNTNKENIFILTDNCILYLCNVSNIPCDEENNINFRVVEKLKAKKWSEFLVEQYVLIGRIF